MATRLGRTSYSNSACFDKDDIWRKKAVHVDDDPLPHMNFVFVKVRQRSYVDQKGKKSEWTFHLSKSYFVENLRERWPGIFFIFMEIWAAVFLTKEPNISQGLFTGGGCSWQIFAVLYCAVFLAWCCLQRNAHWDDNIATRYTFHFYFFVFQESSRFIYFC